MGIEPTIGTEYYETFLLSNKSSKLIVTTMKLVKYNNRVRYFFNLMWLFSTFSL